MTLAKFMKQAGCTLAEFNEVEGNIKRAAQGILEMVKRRYATDTGLYHDTAEIMNLDDKFAPFLMQEMKRIGFEFIENGLMWRY